MDLVCNRCGNRDHDADAERCRACGVPLNRARTATAQHASGWRDTKTWERHLLVRIGALPAPLTEGREFVFGRSSECDITISSPKVSRFHAEIAWKGTEPHLRDRGSPNGTLVNGKPIKEHALADGDELTIGPFTCTYKRVSGRGSTRELEAMLDSQADTQEMVAIAMSGRIEDMGLHEVLETLHYNQKTGTLEVFSPFDVEGRVILIDGAAVFAEVQNLRGEGAIRGLLGWTEGQFRFLTIYDPDAQQNVRRPLKVLLADFAAQDDGSSHGYVPGA